MSQRKSLASIMERAWDDQELRAALKENAKAVLRENGVNIPDGAEVVLHHNTPYTIHLVLPHED